MKNFTLQKITFNANQNLWVVVMLLLFTGFYNVNAQIQLGQDILGLAATDYFGRSVAMSDDGNRMAVGAPFSNAGGNDAGQVRVFDNVGGVWTQVGQTIDGTQNNQHFGWSVSLSNDGAFLAIGAPGANAGGPNRGLVQTYIYTGTAWVQVGNDINGEANGDQFGYEIELNGIGHIVAIGAPFNDGGAADAGHVRVYELNAGTWGQKGADIDGLNTDDFFGGDLALNDAGDRLAVGADRSGVNGTDSGQVRLFEFSGGNWAQSGPNLDGQSGDLLGIAVDLNAAGNVLAIGSSQEGNSGSVRLYDWTGSTTTLDAQILGSGTNSDFGSRIALNALGNRIAVGATIIATGRGQVSFYEKQAAGSWPQRGNVLNGQNNGDYFGSDIDMDASGDKVAIGAFSFDGAGNNAGLAQAFVFDSPPTAVCQNITVQLDASGNAAASAADIDNGSSDAEGSVTLSLDQSTFSCNDIGTPVDVTLTVTDSAGQTDTCTATVTVEDNIDPFILCANATRALDDNGQVLIDPLTLVINQQDNCGIANVSASPSVLTCADIGVNDVTITVTDTSGNTATCISQITVEDNINPTINCPSPLSFSRNVDSGSCAYLAVGTEFDATVTENCTLTSFTNDHNGQSTLDGASFDVGDTIVTWTATDNNGNSSSCSLTVTVVDNIDPVITCVSDTTRDTDSGTCTYVVQGTEFDVTLTDNCTNSSITNDHNNTATLDGEVLPTGDTTVTWTATDASGNSSSCTVTISVEDNTPPIMVCAFSDTRNTNPGQCEYTVQGLEFDPTVLGDNCSVTLTNDFNDTATLNGEVFPTGDTTVTWTATDPSGNTNSCTTTISVVDNEAPVAGCQNATIQLDTSGNYTLSIGEIELNSSDNCGLVNATLSQTVFNCSNIGDNIVTLTVTDAAGNTDQCTATVTVEDNTIPVVTCPSNTIRNQDSGQCYYTVQATEFDPTTNDNCGAVTLTNNFNGAATLAGAQLPHGTTNLVWTATDTNGNQSTCSFIIIVQDVEPPLINCVADATIGTNMGNCTYTVQGTEFDATFTQNCTNASITNDFNNTATLSGAVLPVGATTVTWTATDASGLNSTCTTTITVSDNQNPVISCPGDATRDTLPGQCVYFAVGTEFDATFTTNCSGGSITNDLNGLATLDGENFPTGAPVTVIWTATDGNGNTSTCSMTITIEDNEPPVVVCQDITLELEADGTVSIFDPYNLDGGSSDNCTMVPTFSASQIHFDCSDLGPNTVTLTVTDDDGNSNSCDATVTIVDNIDPVISCPGDATRDGNTDSCDYTVQGTEFDATATDNCTVGSITNDLNNTNTLAGEILPMGDTTIVWTVTDGNGNTTNCTTTVTVTPQDTPGIGCPLNTILPADPFSCEYVLVGTSLNPLIYDHCNDITGYTFENDYNNTATLDGASFPIGTYNITWTLFDAGGTPVDACTFTVTVNPQDQPELACPVNASVTVGGGNCEYTTSNTAFDALITANCNDLTSYTISNDYNNTDTLMGETFPVGVHNITWTLKDASGVDVDTCMFTVTVADNEAPTATCQDITVSLDANGMATITGAQINNGSTDNCTAAALSYSVTPNTFDCNDVGDNMVTLTVTDASGNSSSCMATVTVLTSNNAITCPADATRDTDSGMCEYTVQSTEFDPAFGNVCGNGGAPGSATVSNNINGQSTLAGAVFGVGAHSITWTITYANSSTDSCTFELTIEDNTAPAVACKDLIVQLDSNGMATITASDIDDGSFDNCGTPTLSIDINTFDCSNIGPNIVTLTAMDASNNSSSCTAFVTVQDTTAPAVACQNITVQLDSNGMASITASDIDNGSFDNCGTPALSIDISTFDCSNIGSNTVTLTAIDASNNSTSCTAVVTVQDTTAPAVACQDITVQLDSSGMASITASDIDNGSFDNCGTPTLSIDINTFDCSNTSLPVLVTLTATDMSGNSSTCSAFVTVEENEDPVIVCPSDMTVQPSGGSYILPDYVANNDVTATDNCTSNLTITQSPAAGTSLGIGTHTITFTTQDDSGNIVSCSFVLTVDGTLTIDDSTVLDGIKIFPNPTSDYVTIKKSELANLKEAGLYDIRGRIINTFDLSGMGMTKSINVSHLESGTYFLIIKGEVGFKRFNLIIK